MKAYRCDKCGQFRDWSTPPVKVEWWMEGGEWDEGITIDICPDCAPEVIAPLEAIAKTEVEQ